MRNKSDSVRVALAVLPGSPIFELAVPCEVFGVDRHDLTPHWYDFTVCPTEADARTAGGFIAAQSGSMEDLAQADTVVVPACRNVHESAPAVLLDALRAADQRGARIASICSGAFVLAQAGLLDGRRATTHWMHATELARRYPLVTVEDSVLYVHDDRIWTSAGTAAGIDLCLELVRQDHGAAVANEVAGRMVIPPHRAGGQAQYIRRPPVHTTGVPQETVQAWARSHLDKPITIEDLARVAGVSQRTLIRQFRSSTGLTPGRWLTRERVSLAQQLLETTDLPVDRVAERSGLGTAANLRVHFGRAVGVPPSAYRRTFAEVSA